MAKKQASTTKGHMRKTKAGKVVHVKQHRNNLMKTSNKKK